MRIPRERTSRSISSPPPIAADGHVDASRPQRILSVVVDLPLSSEPIRPASLSVTRVGSYSIEVGTDRSATGGGLWASPARGGATIPRVRTRANDWGAIRRAARSRQGLRKPWRVHEGKRSRVGSGKGSHGELRKAQKGFLGGPRRLWEAQGSSGGLREASSTPGSGRSVARGETCRLRASGSPPRNAGWPAMSSSTRGQAPPDGHDTGPTRALGPSAESVEVAERGGSAPSRPPLENHGGSAGPFSGLGRLRHPVPVSGLRPQSHKI